MSRAALLRYALAKPGAAIAHPWGEDVVKVSGKTFVFFGMPTNTDYGMGVKLTGALLYALSLPYVERMGYGLGKSGWVSVKKSKGRVSLALWKEWIDESYANIAPKRITKAAAPQDGAVRAGSSRSSTRRASRSSPGRGRPTRS